MDHAILIVDDVDLNREMLSCILEEEYTIMEAGDGETALKLVEEHQKDIVAILLDLVMPGMDGYEVMKRLNDMKVIDKIPVLVISGDNAAETEQKCFDYGISDFIGKPFNNMLVKKRVRNAVDSYLYKNQLEEKVAEQTLALRKTCQALRIQADRLKRRNQDVIDMLGTVVEYRNIESGQHIQRVKGYTKILAECFMKEYPEYNLTPEKIETIVSTSALHDIGKITIPDKILLKPGKLTKEEFEYMKSHTTRGCEILDTIKQEWDTEARKISYEICRHHHERYDGKGYPDGLKGEQIPISAQLVSVADVYDALVNERCYKDAFSTDEAFRMIINGECGVFSPKLMEVFRKVRKEFEEFSRS